MVGVTPAPNLVRRLLYRSRLLRAPGRYRPWLEEDLATRGIARRLATVHVMVVVGGALAVAAVLGIPTGAWWALPLVLVAGLLWGVVHVGCAPQLFLERRMRSLVERNDLFLG